MAVHLLEALEELEWEMVMEMNQMRTDQVRRRLSGKLRTIERRL